MYGNREIAIASFSNIDSEINLAIVSRWIVGDWICDVKWPKHPDELIILTANNIVSMWNWKNRTQSRLVRCHDKCLLYPFATF